MRRRKYIHAVELSKLSDEKLKILGEGVQDLLDMKRFKPSEWEKMFKSKKQLKALQRLGIDTEKDK